MIPREQDVSSTKDNLLRTLSNVRLGLITGKGGVGKSLITFALGQALAAKGKRVLMIEMSPFPKLPLFAGSFSTGGQEEIQLTPNLLCANISAESCFREYIVSYLGQEALFRRVFSKKVVGSFLHAMPGLGEALMLGRLFYSSHLKTDNPYDCVLFDGPSSGHFHSLLATPDAILGTGIGGSFGKEVGRIVDFMRNSGQCRTFIVANTDPLSVGETIDFYQRLLRDCPAPMGPVFLNRYWSEKSFQLALDRLARVETNDGDREILLQALTRHRDRSREALDKLAEASVIPYIHTLPDVGAIPMPVPQSTLAILLGAEP